MSGCSSSPFLHHSRRRPLAASVAALFAVSTTSAWAAPPAVTNCNDSGVGSLRYAVDPVNGAVSGDTIDMSGLTGCPSSTITLTTGAITVTQKNLTLIGPGQDALLIKQTAPNSRVILHNYLGAVTPGHLYVEKLRVGYASISGLGNQYGGCIASLYGALTLTNVDVYYCSATTTGLAANSPHAFGGGVFAQTGLSIFGSVLTHDTAAATNANVRAQGGCAMTFGPFDMNSTLMAYCYATGPIGGGRVRGGALELKGGNAIITGSVIGKSQSTFIVGGVDINNGAPGSTATISNSTIAYNYAHYVFGGLYANSPHVNLNNSTIVLNTAGQDSYTFNTHTYNAGVGVSIYSASGALSLQSTIIANNSATVPLENLDLAFGASTGLTFAASNNLVRAYKSDVTLPTGQGNLLQGTCPLLGHIRNNGGGTYTFAPQSGSPVIDAGNNTANDPHTGVPALYDQRGPGYPRVSNGIADIGAHEVQKSDIVFDTEFETNCP